MCNEIMKAINKHDVTLLDNLYSNLQKRLDAGDIKECQIMEYIKTYIEYIVSN